MKILYFLFSAALGYKVETVYTFCFNVNNACHTSHSKDVAVAINKGDVYISHSTTSTKTGMHTMIIYRGNPL